MILSINTNTIKEYMAQNSFKKNCRVCDKKYEISFDKVNNIPIWNFENCSLECSKIISKSKLLNLRKISKTC